ncbi:MAG: hypothetical protein KHY93_08825 [Clostridiales bacterium]|nr:hypothetical protein [Clostridiales bacterium]
MRNRKLFIVLESSILITIFATGVCAENIKSIKEKTEIVQEKEVTTKEEINLKTLGKEEKGAYKIELENKTKRPISSMALKSSKDVDFLTEFVPSGDTFVIDEKRILYYVLAEPADSEEKEAIITYDIKITFGDDGTWVVIHDFPFKDMKKAKILAEDGVGYLEYESQETKEEINTKEKELKIVEEQVAAAEAARAAEAVATRAAESESSQTYVEDYNYYDDSSTGSRSDTTEEYVGGDGCIDAGLVW